MQGALVVVGLVFGILYDRYRQLPPLIAAHWGVDAVVFIAVFGLIILITAWLPLVLKRLPLSLPILILIVTRTGPSVVRCRAFQH